MTALSPRLALLALASAAALGLAACGPQAASTDAPADDHAAAEAAATEHAAAGHAGGAAHDPGEAHGGGDSMWTPTDPGGVTADGFTFHTIPGNRHIVRLPVSGTEVWTLSTTVTGAPAVKLVETRTETAADGSSLFIAEYEMVAAGTVPVNFERRPAVDGPVAGEQTVNFMVH